MVTLIKICLALKNFQKIKICMKVKRVCELGDVDMKIFYYKIFISWHTLQTFTQFFFFFFFEIVWCQTIFDHGNHFYYLFFKTGAS